MKLREIKKQINQFRGMDAAAPLIASGVAEANAAAATLRAKTIRPLVSRSKRCTNSRLALAGRARRSCSITPKLTPLPPCTATPAGLSMANSASSSISTGNSRAGAGASALACT